MTRKQLAKELGIDVGTLRKKIKMFEIDLPQVRQDKSVAVRLREQFTTAELEEISQYKLAKLLKTSQPNVCNALKKLGITSRVRKQMTTSVAERCQKVIDFIEENGGNVVEAIRKSGVRIDKGSVYKHAQEIDFDLKAYRFAHRDYGYWTTCVGRPQRYSTADYKLEAVCNLCDTKHTVQLVNIRAGMSQKCKQCAQQYRRGSFRKVRCTATGKTFKSIRAWVIALGRLPHYQSMRIKIMRDGEYKYNDIVYQLKE